MKDKSVWFGFLEAGTKSSPVARDPQLETNKATTVYLYNLNKQEFVEYNREIVEPKLRELNGKEDALKKELEAAFKKARKTFKGNNSSLSLSKATPIAPAKKPAAVEESVDVDDGDDNDFNDDDWDSDD